MAIDNNDEIAKMLDNELPPDVKEEVRPINTDTNETSVRFAPTNSNVNDASEDETEISLELTGCAASPFCDPRRMPHRFIALIMMCLLGFGSTFCYDNPGALQDNIKSDMGINTAQFANLYAWYSWPNVILCFIGGFLLDRVFGTQLGTILFATLVLLGQIVFALGGILNKFWLMEVGRLIFGIGGESLAVAQNTYAVSWFKGKELNMVFGLQLSFARLGSTVNFNVMSPVYNYVSQYYTGYLCTGVALMFASVSCLLSLVSALILGYLDKRANRILKKSSQSGEVIRFSDVKDFPASFWLMAAICVAYYVAIFPFIGLGQVFFERKFDFTPSSANAVNSIVYVISAIVSPFFGLLVDKVGRNILMVFIAIVFTIGSHALLTFTFINPYVGMITMGVSYSMLASALWPMVALVVPEYQLGTAYGIMQAVQNLGMAIVTMMAGRIVDDQGYLVLEVFFLAWLCLSLVATVLIWVMNASRGGLLNMSVAQRDKHERELMSKENLEREKFFASGSMSDVTPYDLLQPRSDFALRNRYLSRIGAKIPEHLVPQASMVYRALR